MDPPKVVVYTRPGCHLCDAAKEVLEQYGLSPQMVDIEADEELAGRFGQWIPVVEIDGQVRFRGQVDEVLLQRLLVGRRS
jgi:glutaredoxin